MNINIKTMSCPYMYDLSAMYLPLSNYTNTIWLTIWYLEFDNIAIIKRFKIDKIDFDLIINIQQIQSFNSYTASRYRLIIYECYFDHQQSSLSP